MKKYQIIYAERRQVKWEGLQLSVQAAMVVG